ncbi:class I SAM-dependent methyltransferase [Actinoplanes philippinensis]|uniref:class I SAM-dependent methyltransferase n=1 Tax=Actinoplanes philippinensis TaxID=35752 RepID=UPI00340C89D7
MADARPVPNILDLADVTGLYRKYADDLAAARDGQRALLKPGGPRLRPKLDDIEAELTYLLVRHHRPRTVAEIGTFHGWSTTWLLRALRDNGEGELRSYDIVDHARRSVPAALADGRWTFHHGDVRQAALTPGLIDYLFIDAAHTAPFARWYTARLFGQLRPGTPVSVHDVYHRRRAGRFSEGRVVLDWLAQRRLGHFTASRAAAPAQYAEILAVRESLGLAEPVHQGGRNPMIFFRLGGN